jgi:hypothetical protein
MSSRSNSARAPKTWKISLPPLLAVSMPSRALKADSAAGESVYGLDKMLQGTAEPIKFPHHQRVSVAREIDSFSQAFSRIDSAAGDIAENLFAPGLLE